MTNAAQTEGSANRVVPATPVRTAALGLFVIFVLFPAVTLGALTSEWIGLVSGLVCVAVAMFVRTDRNLFAPRILCGVFGLLAIVWAIWFLVRT